VKKIFILFIILSSISCKKNEKFKSFTAYGITIDSTTEPMKIAEVLIKALDEENDSVLKLLVAVKSEKNAIKEIYKKYYQKPREMKDENIRKLVISGWMLTYSFFEKGNTYITGDKVGEDSAFVYASGLKINGERRNMMIRMVKEDGFWKVLGGIKEF